MEFFYERLAYLMELNNVNSRKLADGIPCHMSQISRWKKRKLPPSDASLTKLTNFFSGSSRTWLANNTGKPYPVKPPGNLNPNIEIEKTTDSPQTAESTPEHQSTADFDMQKFKAMCSANFDHVFEFISDNYGQDSVGIQMFLDDLQDVHHPYRVWFYEKKQERKDNQTEPEGSITANDK